MNLDSLNENQLKAVEHIEGPCMVLAGPGSGKTRVITYRIANMVLNKNIQGARILAISFTKASSMEMKNRLMAISNDVRLSKVTCGTFHSVFFRILRYFENLQLKSIVDDKEKRYAIKNIIKNLKIENTDDDDTITQIMTEISYIKNELMNPSDFNSDVLTRDDFTRVYSMYEGYKENVRKIDFDDMLVMAKEILDTNPEILLYLRSSYPYIQVDEYQDTNYIQRDIVYSLAGENGNLAVVGDDDQSIYHFRGAKPEIMLNFTKDNPKAETVLLNINYRCTKNVLQAAMNVVDCNKKRFQKQLSTPNEQGKPVRMMEFDNPREEYMRVSAFLKKRLDAGEDLEDTAVLFRTNQEAEGLVGALMEYQIPFTMKEQLPNLFRHWICKNMLAYLKMAQGDRSRSTFLEIMNRPNRYIAREALAEKNIDFKALAEFYKDKDWMCDRITTLETHLRILKTMAPYAAINFIRNGMGYEEYLREYAQYRKIKPEELLETLDRIHESAKGMKTLAKWQAYIEEYTKRLNEQARKQQDNKEGVTISTLHAVKGLEYDIVYILNVNEGSIPYRKAVLAEAVEEERRLFYVGMTRAKKKLVLAYVKRQYEKEREPSRFLEETGL